MSLEDFKKHMRSTPVSSLFPPKRNEIVTITSNTPISDVFKLLAKHGILSVPVLDKSLAKPRYTAFVDIIDIVAWILDKFPHDQSPQDIQIESLPPIFEKHPASELIGKSERNPYYPVEDSAPLEAAITLMSKKKIHRIPVVDSEQLVSIVTQSQVLHYLYDHMYLMDDFKLKTVAELKLGFKEVVCIDEHESAINAFKMIYEKKISAVGVVNGSGELVGNISASSIKALGYKHHLLKKLYLPAKDFLIRVKEAGHGKEKVQAIASNRTLADVVKLLVDQKIHRVYITDNHHKPLGVISLTDILICLGS